MATRASKKAPVAKTVKTCAIVGFAPTWQQTPWDDPAIELWGMNALHRVAGEHNWARWYQLHDIDVDHGKNDFDHLGWLRAQKTLPVYMWEEHIEKYEIPGAVPFPKEQVMDFFGTDYFTNTVSWMVAHAIMDDYKNIQVYGVDMAQDALSNAEYCVAPETRVLTSDLRWVPASTVKVGDDLVGFDEYPPEGSTYRSWQRAKVLGVKRLIRPSYRLYMSDGTKLESSAEHRWLSADGKGFKWNETENLHGPIVTSELQGQIRDEYAEGGTTHRALEAKYGLSRAAVQRTITGVLDPDKCRTNSVVKVVEPWEGDHSWEAGYLAAAFDGEGHLSMTRRKANRSGFNVQLGFSQRENGMSRQFEETMDRLGFTYRKHDGSDCIKYAVTGGRAEFVKLLGTVRPQRLLGSFDPGKLGVVHKAKAVDIVDKEFLGDRPVVGIHTDTGTFVAEGFASHNSWQRPSCEFFLGWARGSGCEVYLPPESDLLKTPYMYGAENGGHFRVKMEARLKELKERQATVQQQLGNNQAALHQLSGAIEDTMYYLRAWSAQYGVAPSPNGNGSNQPLEVPSVQ